MYTQRTAMSNYIWLTRQWSGQVNGKCRTRKLRSSQIGVYCLTSRSVLSFFSRHSSHFLPLPLLLCSPLASPSIPPSPHPVQSGWLDASPHIHLECKNDGSSPFLIQLTPGCTINVSCVVDKAADSPSPNNCSRHDGNISHGLGFFLLEVIMKLE